MGGGGGGGGGGGLMPSQLPVGAGAGRLTQEPGRGEDPGQPSSGTPGVNQGGAMNPMSFMPLMQLLALMSMPSMGGSGWGSGLLGGQGMDFSSLMPASNMMARMPSASQPQPMAQGRVFAGDYLRG